MTLWQELVRLHEEGRLPRDALRRLIKALDDPETTVELQTSRGCFPVRPDTVLDGYLRGERGVFSLTVRRVLKG